MSTFDDRGQIYTIEGFASALILVGVLFFIFQSISVVTPQTEMSSDMKLSQKAADTLICLDHVDEDYGSVLKNAIATWNGGTVDYASRVNPAEVKISEIDRQIAGMLPDDALYNLNITYNDGSGAWPVRTLILGGVPNDNSVVATRLVTINENDIQSDFWKLKGYYPQLVEVRLICWYI
jgi:hypothetical protein